MNYVTYRYIYRGTPTNIPRELGVGNITIGKADYWIRGGKYEQIGFLGEQIRQYPKVDKLVLYKNDVVIKFLQDSRIPHLYSVESWIKSYGEVGEKLSYDKFCSMFDDGKFVGLPRGAPIKSARKV